MQTAHTESGTEQRIEKRTTEMWEYSTNSKGSVPLKHNQMMDSLEVCKGQQLYV